MASMKMKKMLSSKWIKNLNARFETLKLLQEKTGRYRHWETISE
jgi:hypothetical protein